MKTSPQTPPPERIEAILIDMAYLVEHSFSQQPPIDTAIDQARTQINLLLLDFVNEVVGGVEVDHKPVAGEVADVRTPQTIRNRLRAEIKERATTILKGGE